MVLEYMVIMMKVINLTKEGTVVYNYCSKYASVKIGSMLESFVLANYMSYC